MNRLTKEQIQQIQQWNNTDTTYPADHCIHHYLEQQARLTPNNKAVSYKGYTVTYKQLDNLSNSLATQLIEQGIRNEDFVPVYMNRSIELIVSIYAILKAGGVYVPLSTALPKERINAIIDDTSATVLLSNQEQPTDLPLHNIITIDNNYIRKHINQEVEAPVVSHHSHNLAYAIFTSGTTGKPKGVLIEHHSVINRICWMQKQYPIDQNDVLLQKTPISFDVSVWELFWWTFVGAHLVLLPNGYEKEPDKLAACIHEQAVSVIHFVPSMFYTFIGYLNSAIPDNNTASLKWIICSGEELLESMVNDYYTINDKLGNNATIANLYGPTEATVDVTYHTCERNITKPVPIGRPIDNTKIYIVNEQLEILPFNEKGELLICGVNLARCYLNREILNREKFIDLDVFGHKTRAYRTGDLAMINYRGDIIYHGRNDQQVKIRGFRIELNEIENVLLKHPSISECACIVHNKGEVSAGLVCFYIPVNNVSINAQELKLYLAEYLPEYMLPMQYLQTDKMPLSGSGKLDRQALIHLYTQEDETHIQQPQVTGMRQKLVAIWSKLLKRKKVSTDANFFDVGGNSLLIVQMAVLIKQELGINIDAISLMQYTTIDDLAAFLEQQKNT